MLRKRSQFRVRSSGQIYERFFLVGPSGSGKSALSAMVAESARIRRFDTDSMIIDFTDLSTIAEVFDTHGETSFRDYEVQAIRKIGDVTGACVVATGGGLPAIPGMMERLNSLGVTIYLRASVDTLWKRLSMDPDSLRDRPLLREGGKASLETLITHRASIYQSAAITYDTDRLSAEKVREFLLDVVDRYRV